ncbi:general secretion pathway protein GspK [Candidatus Entotheonella palauensis]|uniref:general secretion pathway protein GspK n=1 Tax=Candidatus Entotheonella palauensis TaxID=93172 RepID=UPI0015C43772|nr:type II secretion system protein GspK [Candidatus Entotheonella palauensis]
MGRHLWQRMGAPLGNDRGAVLVITIFVVALVTILVLEYHYDAAVEIELAENHANDVKAYQLAMSGLNFAQAVLSNDTNEYDAPNELWHNLETFGCIAPNDLLNIAKMFVEAQLKSGEEPPEEPPASESAPQACVALKIVDENRKLPINRILEDETELETPWAGIAALLLSVVWDGEEGQDLPEDAIGAVMDWIDRSEGSIRGGDVGGEDDYYQTLDPPYKTPGRKLEVPGELRMIRWFTSEEEPKYQRLAKLFDGLQSNDISYTDLGTNLYFSTFDYDQVNINTVHPSILLAITNNSETCFSEIVEEINQRKPSEDEEPEPFKTDQEMEAITCLATEIPVTDLPEIQFTQRDPNTSGPDSYTPDEFLAITSTHFRVESQAIIDGQINKKVVAVFHREPGRGSGNPAESQERPQMVYFKIE